MAAAAAENVNLWNLKTGEKTLSLISGEKHEVSCIAVKPSGETLAVGYEDGSLRLFNLQNGNMINYLELDSAIEHTYHMYDFNVKLSKCITNFII